MIAALPVGWWTFWLGVGAVGFGLSTWLLLRIAAALDDGDGDGPPP